MLSRHERDPFDRRGSDCVENYHVQRTLMKRPIEWSESNSSNSRIFEIVVGLLGREVLHHCRGYGRGGHGFAFFFWFFSNGCPDQGC